MNAMKQATIQLLDWSIILGMVLWLASIVPAVAALPQTPTESVRSTIEDVMHILTNEQLKQPDRLAERRQAIERIVRSRVSYEDMAKQALGLPWLNLEAEERQEFVDLFVQLLRDSFAGKIDTYADEQVLYLSEQRDDRMAEVRTKLTGRKTDSSLNFRLADRAGTWLVYDVVIDGASIVHNYRAQFARIIRDVSYPGLVKLMREKTLVVKVFQQGHNE
jgi:phospholipid transport system substrate-binding protein